MELKSCKSCELTGGHVRVSGEQGVLARVLNIPEDGMTVEVKSLIEATYCESVGS